MIMAGRYGLDRFSRFLLISGIIVFIPSVVLYGKLIGDFFRLAAVLLAGFGVFRIFSRNFEKRIAENDRYLLARNRVTGIFGEKKDRVLTQNDYRYFNCPECGAKMRVPKYKGKIMITCPKCGHEFQRKT